MNKKTTVDPARKPNVRHKYQGLETQRTKEKLAGQHH
jgi:hypothetical protein